MKRRLLAAAARVLGAVFLILLGVWLVVAQPTLRKNRRSDAAVDPARLRGHVEQLARTFCPRDWRHPENLDRVADYVAGHFRRAGARVEFQDYTHHDRSYRNVRARFGAGRGPRVVVGAHYDACGEEPGADDNASGVAVLIELANLLGREAVAREVELVAYTLEEPPFFRTAEMGSARHAQSLADEHTNIVGVIVLEMVGYFSDVGGSQSYPVPMLRLLYPGRANFIGVIGPWNQGRWVKAVKRGMQGATDLPVYSIRAPAAIPGVDFSDHMNYWKYGIDALMITDTAFYRNTEYHQAGDTPDRLDYARMAQVAVSVWAAIRNIP